MNNCNKNNITIAYMPTNNAVSLADYVAKLMRDKELSGYDVARLSGSRIDQSYVNRIKNGEVKNPSSQKMEALALGLGVDVRQIERAARGEDPEPSEFDKSLLYAAAGADKWTPEQKQRFITLVRTLADAIRLEKQSKN